MVNCSFCGKESPAVACEGCGKAFCRGLCWREHWCGPITDSNGNLVKVGDILQYLDSVRTYVMLPTPGTYQKGGIMFGARVDKRRPKEEHVITRPRLMQLQR